MKTKYKFEFVLIDDGIMAVPFGERANEFHGVIKLNEVGADILCMLSNETTKDELVQNIAEKYDASIEMIKKVVDNAVEQFELVSILE